MSPNVNNSHFDQDTLDQNNTKTLEGKLLGLTGNILALRIELTAEHKKLEGYFKILSKQIYEIKKDLDYIRSYLDIELEETKNDDRDGWISAS